MPFDPYKIRSPEEIMRAAQFPGGMITPPAVMKTAAKVKGAGLFDRLGSAIMPAGQVEGLISPEDIQRARSQGMLDIGISLLNASGPKTAKERVGLMGALGQGLQAGRAGFNEAVQGAAGLRNAGLQQKELQQKVDAGSMALDKEKNIQAGRAKILAAYPMPKDKNGLKDWIAQVLPHFIAINDDETRTSLSEIYKSLGGEGQKNGHWMETPGPDGKPRTIFVTPEMAGEGVPTYEKPQRDTNAALTLNSRLTGEEKITNNYMKRIEDVKSTADAYVGAYNASKMGGAGDLQILYSFIRALDPGSVVREGEISLARQSASLWSQAHILKNKFETQGGTLSPVQRQQMLELMKQMVELKKDRVDTYKKDTENRAKRFGLTVDLYDPLENYRALQAQQSQAQMPGVVGGSSSSAPPVVAPKGAEWFQ